uniref:Uncharacterized protein n=1 Tax=Picea glauca TaxID=3330 RepID=A0A124GNV2_PICGL|nr:hypothetical protein ABT39_MTgene3196 [Picea glauca]
MLNKLRSVLQCLSILYSAMLGCCALYTWLCFAPLCLAVLYARRHAVLNISCSALYALLLC